MFIIRHFFTACALIAVLALAAGADEAKPQAETKAPPELKNQTLCPVMGGKIDSTVFTDIQGQRVYHCCPMCSDKLKVDPDKYFKKAAAEGVLFENTQTTCPVSGEKLEDKSVYTDFDGRRVAFCCKKCRGRFDDDPAKYLKKLDERAGAEAEKKTTMDHSGHNH
ncbi:MAG: YHS domain-containing protein [bacterium]